jgi:hypothetical protein
LPLTFSTTLDNLDTRYIYVALAYVYNVTRVRQSGQITDRSRQHRVQLSANSRYFRNLLLRGDNLFLEGFTSYTTHTGRGPNGHTILADTKVTYYLPLGLNLSGGYNHLDNSGTPGQISETLFGELQWVTFLWRSLSLVSSVRETKQFNKYAQDVETLSGNASLGYQIGRVSLSAQYSIYQQESKVSEVTTQTVYFRAVRPF